MHTTTNSTVNPLHHAGELLRCRAAPRSRTSEQMLSEISGNDKGGGDQNNPLESSTSFASQRPSLRAYSASLFLYSPSFPPYIYRNHKRDLMTRAGAEHDIVEAERQQPVGNMRTRYRIDDESSTCPMTATAKYTTVSASSDNLLPGRGYLHKYMGYAQEKITPFRAATKVSQKCCNYTGKHARDHNLTSSTVNQGRHYGRTNKNSCDGEPAGAADEASSANATASVEEGRHLRGLYLEAPEVPPDCAQDSVLHKDCCVSCLSEDNRPVTPVMSKGSKHRCRCGSKGRSGGAHRVIAWGSPVGAKVESRSSISGNNVTLNKRTAHRAGKEVAVRKRPAFSSAFLPYNLNRPVTPKISPAFSYICN